MGSRRVWVRALVTVIACGVAWAAQGLLLPGLETWKLTSVKMTDLTSLSVVALGLSPALSGFWLVELAALLVPPWRRLRTGPEGRAALRRSALIATLAIASVQGWFIVRWLESTALLRGGSLLAEPGPGSQLLITVTLVAGTCFLLALTWLIDRYGLGNGFSMLLASGLALPVGAQLYARIARDLEAGDLEAKQVFLVVVLVAMTIAATAWVLTLHKKTQSPLRHPTSGLVPYWMAATLLLIPSQLAVLGWSGAAGLVPPPGSVAFSLTKLVLAALLCVGFSRLFNGRARLAEVLGPDADVAALVRAATFRTVAYVVAICAIDALLVNARLIAVDVGLVIVLTAVAIDLATEWRARQLHDDLVAVWPLHQVALVGAALDALAGANIPAHARGAHHRALLQVFGPFVSIDLLVPAARAADAQRVLTALLVGGQSTVPAVAPARPA
jgi:hypothetical protein